MEFLNSLKFSRILHHNLQLKISSPTILLRNINQSVGLCNDTKLIITQLTAKVIEAMIIAANHVGIKV